ncbi:MAG TPA: tRNA (adenosine(37)-N6)-dimethylallyltransferase MiaA [Candidatus Moranbacteria bacterium]|nr:tRNA (adenosine(37)-N6)-dimethylallyltransferase MiaA [Candidatus Moranbacteria bacterium]
MNKIIVILGPTASGKSDVAIKLAKKFDGEIISADSRQVYRGMDIGTGKVTPAEQKTAVHHMLDVADPNDEFNVSHFKKLTEKKIGDILKRGKLPIVCGGTGFWIQSIVDDLQLPEVKPNKELRNILRNKSAEELFAMLEKLDPQRAENIDAKNKVRLIRAIEICKAIGKVPKTKVQHQNVKKPNAKYDFLQIGIEIEKEILNQKIKKRLDSRFDDGMLQEVENLHQSGVSWERLESFGLEYRWIARYLQEKISLDEMADKLYFDIIHYAKRQMTWFKRDKRILWLKDYAEIEKAVQKFLK